MIANNFVAIFCFVTSFQISIVNGRVLNNDMSSSTSDQYLKSLMLWGSHIYYVSIFPAAYKQAVQICANAGASLANIESPYESFTLSRRFAGSDFGDHLKYAYTTIDQSTNGTSSKTAIWIGNNPFDSFVSMNAQKSHSNIRTHSPQGPRGLSSSLNAQGHACMYLEFTEYKRNGAWRNDEPCDSARMHFVCKKAVALASVVKTYTLFASFTLDCLVSPEEIAVSHVYKNEDQNVLMVFVPYPSTCDTKGESSTVVVAVDVRTSAMPVRFFIVDPRRRFLVLFKGGLLAYVGSMDDILGRVNSVSQIL
eukprot:TRINITY_DN1776_c0_g1_i1.p1 TRINITY_DN1776_c0_g1~~TRINITY_DN1776_c0_g1_i1.p1  ORF type:complete len:360 (-),score=24.81 TRINITY_DN1776_c0_g1_i1:1364-2287(-)